MWRRELEFDDREDEIRPRLETKFEEVKGL